MHFSSSRIRTSTALILLVLGPVVFFRSVLFHPTRHIPYDLVGFHAPLADYAAWSFGEGRVPLWDPNPYCGYPIHADPQAQLFYPPAWLAFAAGALGQPGKMLYWLEWLVALHMVLAGWWTFALVRRQGCTVPAALLAGIVFQLGAFFASQAQHLGAVCGAAWMPLAWLAALELRERPGRRWFAVLAATLGLVFLSGFAALTIVAFFSTGLVFVISRPRPVAMAWFAGAVAAVALLGAVQLFPTLELTPWSVASLRPLWNRGAGTPLRAWLSFFWPNYHQVFHPFDSKLFHDDYQFTMLYCYSGAAAVAGCVMGLVRRAAWRWLALAAVFVALQSGNRIPGFDAVLDRMPALFKGALYADFFLAAACLAIAVVTGIAFSRLGDRLVWVVALATAVELVLVASNRPMNTEERSWRQVTSALTINGDAELPANVGALVRRTAPPVRLDVLDMNYSFTMNASMRRLPTANGDSPFAPLRVVELRRTFGEGNWWDRQLPVQKPGSALLRYMNVGLLIAETAQEKPAELAGWRAVEGGKWMRLYERAPLARYFLVGRTRVAASAERALAAMQTVDLSEEAVLEEAVEPVVSGGQVRVVRYEPDRVELETESTGAALLVGSDSYHPGWMVTVDGRPARMVRANYAFRGVRLEGGRHRVEMRYRPVMLGWWAVVSGLSWVLLILTGLLQTSNVKKCCCHLIVTARSLSSG